MIISRNIPTASYNLQGAGQTFSMNTPPIFGADGMPTKSTSKMIDEDFKTAIEELAKKDFAAGRNKRDYFNSAEYKALSNSYISRRLRPS